MNIRNRSTQIVIGVVVALVVVALVVLLVAGGSSTSSRSATTIPAGYTNHPTVTTLPANVPHPARPRPSVLPPEIYSTGACKTAMDGVRALFVKYPSGLDLPAAGSAALNAGLVKVRKACTPALLTAFGTQELSPWLNYSVKKS